MRKTIDSIRRNVQRSAHSSMLVLASVLVLQGCSSTGSSIPSSVFTGSTDCGYIGCSTGNVRFYRFDAEWKHPCTQKPEEAWDRFPYGSADWKNSRKSLTRCMANLGLDINGQPIRR